MSVPDTQQALLSLIEETFPDRQTTLVKFRPPLEVPKQHERVYLLEEDSYELGSGEQYRIEAFRPRFAVDVYRSGDNAQAASDRRWEIIYAVDAVLHDADFEGYRDSGHLIVVPRIVGYDQGYLALATCTITASTLTD